MLSPSKTPAPAAVEGDRTEASIRATVDRVNAEFAAAWAEAGVEPAPPADDLAVIRRLSLGLTGSVPSLEEIRAFEARPEGPRRIQWWLSHLFEDSRSADYLAERYARAFVGVENGPFLVYRRGRLVSWLSGQFRENRPYDELVRDLIAAEGLWTSNPEANFITATIDQNEKKRGPDEIKLAARTTRAFLGVRIDCMQCHDDKFGDRWKQEDFHQLAAFYAGAEMRITGVQDRKNKVYEFRYLGERDEQPVPQAVPFSPELLPSSGAPRERLAKWATHPENRAFSRAAVNRVWAILFGRPLVEAIDDIPLEGPYPPGLESLADDFVAHDFDLRHLIRTIAATRPYTLDSRSGDPARPVTEAEEMHWAAFPLTRLRPEQIAGGVTQAASLDTLDDEASVLRRIQRFGDRNQFVKRWGDPGEEEFAELTGTIPQRLLMMNGNLVKERTSPNPVMNASTRIGALSGDPTRAVEAAYLCVLTRRPTPEETEFFAGTLEKRNPNARNRAMEDLFWTLMNATEFSWNH